MKFTDNTSKMINRLLLAGFLAVCALYCLTPIHNGNFFWHLRNGEDILDTAEIRTVDQFTWTARGRTWLQQEWLAEVTFAATWRSVGESGPVLLKTLIIILSVLFMVLAARCRGANIPAVIVTGLLWFMLSYSRWIVRPHIISIFFFSLYLYLLARGTGGILKSLAIFIPLQIVWTNAHAGFLMGYFLLGIPVIDNLLDRNWKNSLEKSGILAAAILTSGIHPNGFRSLTYITDFLSRPLFRQSIREWWSPFHPLYQPGHRISTTAILLVALLAATWILIIIRRKKIKTVHILALIALSSAALITSRNIDMLAIAAVVWVSPLLTGIPARFSGALLACAAAVPFIFGIPREFGPARGIGTGVDWSIYPYRLADFLEENPELLEARIFNTNEISGYLEYVFGERLPLYIDGRCHLFSEKFYAEYLLLSSAEKSNASLVLDIYHSQGIDLALFDWPKKERSSAYILSASPEWCPIYWDDLTIAYARKPFIDSIDFQWHSFPHVDPLFPDQLMEIPFYQLPESWIDEILLAASLPMNYEPAIILSSALLLRNGTLGSIDTLPFHCGNDDLERAIISALNGEEPCIHDPRLRVIQSWAHSRAGRYKEAMEAAIASEEQRVISCTAILSGESTRSGSEGNITVPPPMVPSGAWERYLSGNLSQDDCRIIEASALLVCGMQEKAVDSIRTIIFESGNFSPWAFSVSGAVMALSGLDSLASVLGDSAISINRNPYTLLIRGQIAEIAGNLDEAVSMFEQSLQISPVLHEARFHLALCLWMKGDIQDAIQDYHILMDLNYLTPAAKSMFEWGEYLSGNVNRERS